MPRIFGSARVVETDLFTERGFDLGEGLILSIRKSGYYRRLVASGYTFRISKVLTYQLGSVVPNFAIVLFEFLNIDDDDMVLLVMKHDMTINPDISEYMALPQKPFTRRSATRWENLIVNFGESNTVD